MLNHKKGLYSRKSSIAILIFLALISLISFTDIKYQYLGITGFAVNILGANDAVITVNTSQSIGIIRDDFYGANTHGSWLGEGTKIDKNGDGVKESDSNLTWHRQAWLDSGMKMMRWDAYLESNYEGPIENLGFENWSNSSTKYISSDSETGADSWKISPYDGGRGYVGRSNDAHSGSYSLNITTTQDDHLYFYRKLQLKEGKNYNFSVWVKGNGTFSIAFQRLDNYSNCGYRSFNLNSSTWQQISINCTAKNSDRVAFRFLIDSIDIGEYLLIDDLEILEGNLPYRPDFTFIGDLTFRNEQLKWSHDNNIKTLIVSGFMPAWIANKTSGCNIYGVNGVKRCAPKNYTLFANLVSDYLNRLTQEGIYSQEISVEVWNEPNIGFWLDALPEDHSQKLLLYNLLYSEVYESLKNSNYYFGGPALAHLSSTDMVDSFLSNFSNKFNFFSFHRYSDGAYGGIYSDINYIFSKCKSFNSNCDYIILSEWNGLDNFNNYSFYSHNLASGYINVLNNWPTNVSMILYQWSEQYKYSNTQNYPEYPQKWHMVSEPGLDNEYTPAYNVTKNFAHFHAGGDRVVNSSSDNTNIKVVSSMKPNGTIYTTVISTASTNTSVTLNYKGKSVYGLKNIETNILHIASNGIINLGSFSQYDVKYYVEVAAPAPGDTTAPVVSIITPKAIEYTNYTIPVSIGINENGYCSYSIDNGKTNKSLSSSNTRNFTSSLTVSGNGDYTLRADCFDMSVNRAYSQISFSVEVVTPTTNTNTGTSSGGGGGGGGGGGTGNTNYSGTVGNSYDEDNPISNSSYYPDYGIDDSSGSAPIDDSDNGRLINSDKVIEPKAGILGRVISDIEDSSGKSIGYIVLILAVVGVLLFCIVAMVDAINVHKSKKKKYAALKEWIGDNHSKGYEHEHLKEVLLNHGWSEKMIDKAIDEHLDQIDEDKYRIGFLGKD